MTALGDALRQAADWVDEHEEAAAGMNAFVGAGFYGDNPREHLERIGTALGPDAQETVINSTVYVERWFGEPYAGVRVYGSAPLAKLQDPPQPPVYRPILDAERVAS